MKSVDAGVVQDWSLRWPTHSKVRFYLLAVGLSLISIYILVRTITWVRSLKKEETQG